MAVRQDGRVVITLSIHVGINVRQILVLDSADGATFDIWV